jgi:Ca-activated chloride channel family protein
MRRFVVAVLQSFLVLATAAPLVGAQGWILPRRCGIGARPMDERIPNMVPVRDCRPNIARTRSDVRVEMVGRVLKYEVDERFINRGATIGEADYLFPLPQNAAFQDLKLSINGELISGETMNVDQARRIYENIVRSQRDPALVEWMGHGLLHARIFPINPGEEKRVVVRFQTVAPREGDALRIDYYRGAGQQNQSAQRDGGSSTFTLSYAPSSEIGTPFSPTHTLDFTERDGQRVVSARGDARDLTLLLPMRRSSAASISMLPYAPGNEDGFALITVTPPPVARDQTTPRDVTLVLDVSGSMQGKKMEQARAAGRQLIGTLRPEDRFRLIDFSSDVRTFRDEFLPAASANLRDANRYLDALEAQGGTNIEGALREATRPAVTAGRLPLVLFITDGEPTVGETRADRLASIGGDAAPGSGPQRRIFTFGLGSDVNVSLLEQLALEGRGTAEFVRPDESVERSVGLVANRLVDPILTDVRVRVDGDARISKLLPATMTDVFADRDLVLLARYSGHGSARVIVEGNRRGTSVTWTSAVDFPERERQNPFVARLWAAQRVGYLSAEKRKHGGSVEFDDEIRSLGEHYGIPTEFTSYLVTEPRFATARMTSAGNGAVSPAPMAMQPVAEMSSKSRAFEAAKVASVQRSMNSVAVMDSLSRMLTDARADRASTRRVDARTFVLRDGVWTDERFHTTRTTLRVKPFSKAYFDLSAALPELRAVFALGNRVAVAGRDRAIVLADDGVDTITSAALSALTKAW